ncbi:MAG: 2-oxoglutarate and iron-dependent oxygenase domain-containing protein [Pseudomonadota bacterium]
MTIPLVDLARWTEGDEANRSALTAEVDAHLAGLGFLMVTNHGISPEISAAARDQAQAFFELSSTSKAAYTCPSDAYRGWVGPGLESNSASYGVDPADAPVDLKEAYSIGPAFAGAEKLRATEPRWFAPNIWPNADLPEFQPAMLAWMRAADRLTCTVLNILTRALGLRPDWVSENCGRAMATVTINRYPRVDPGEGGWRVGAHTDFGTVTILDRNFDNGLQVEQRAGKWVEAPVVPGALTVNLGEMMVLISGGRWRANPHRVVAEPGMPECLSLVYFHSPNHDVTLPDAAGTSAGSFLGNKMDQIVRSPERAD